MSDQDVLQLVCAGGIVPVVVVEDADHVRGLGSALKRGGLPVAEVTLRTEASIRALRALATDGDLLVGAGTVIRAQQVDIARDAGARFVVTPGFSARVIERCRELGMPVIPGVSTATEVIAALDHGCELLKFFPAEASGGAATIRALQGPFPHVRFIPTGGVSAAGACVYLRLPSVAAVGGSWMVAPELLREGDFARVSRLAEEAVLVAAQARP
ncbi:MAG TPA: bifunctional 4-hydroxy-2-oxoglutarate aldolase/2-dehydro-3-deoxy-phosphogluconate aldolase [Solirubrobacteraceae bacterium]|jgi:2-dehydro-3-deoxyphosphogluconate aldolase/(4S)-4-hydroxy-2-oxoglutarate aldolase|nr:bifunctional 4-hydroxy-2-oxoglutarate aldolase/2-dehydro-3-deoxy-phosphogluconate aldolase [Solirubrobacteraceae bacterium]